MMKKLSISWILSVSLFGALMTSCVEPKSVDDVRNNQGSETLMMYLDQALREVHGIESDVSRGLMLRSLREQDKQVVEDILYELRLSLFRLRNNPSDFQAANRLDSYQESLKSEINLLQADQARMEKLMVLIDNVLTELGFVFPREKFAQFFRTEFGDFETLKTVGDAAWTIDAVRNIAVVSGFQKGVTESWLISPRFDLTNLQMPYFEFEQAVGYLRSWDDLDVVISTNYEGGHPESADWQPLFIDRIPSGEINWEYVKSEQVSLDEFAGQKVVVAFRYRSLDEKQATWQVSYFKLGGAGELSTSPVSPSLELDGGASNSDQEKYTHFFSKDFGGFQPLKTVGDAAWRIDTSRSIAVVSGFQKGVTESWLISPRFDLGKMEAPYFETHQAVGFLRSWDDLDILVSSNYSGGKPDAADWQKMTIERRPSGDVNWQAVASEKVSLADFAGQKIVVAFRYRSTEEKQSTWQISYFKLGGNGSLSSSPINVSEDPSEDDSNAEPYETLLDVSFAKELAPFTNFTIVGDEKFHWAIDAERQLARASGRADNQDFATEIWLVSPKISLKDTTKTAMQFEQSVGFLQSWDDLQVKISTDFSGDVTAATWQEIIPEKRPEGRWASLKTGRISLDEFIGKDIVIGFQYRSSTAGSSTWQIKDLTVEAIKVE
ncbi:MAG: choice-of-anchor J domain-containing protein [Oligoflexus sp.]